MNLVILQTSSTLSFLLLEINLKKKIISHISISLNISKEPNSQSIFLSPTNSKEVALLIFSFQKNKSTGPNSIPTDVDISKPIEKIVNLSFPSVVVHNMKPECPRMYSSE